MMMLVRYSGNIGNGSWDSVQCEYVLPAELRPPVEVNGMVCVSNGQTARMLSVKPDGTIVTDYGTFHLDTKTGEYTFTKTEAPPLCYPIP